MSTIEGYFKKIKRYSEYDLRTAVNLEKFEHICQQNIDLTYPAYWFAFDWEKLTILFKYANNNKQILIESAARHLFSEHPNDKYNNNVRILHYHRLLKLGLTNVHKLIEGPNGIELAFTGPIDNDMYLKMLDKRHYSLAAHCFFNIDTNGTIDILIVHRQFDLVSMLLGDSWQKKLTGSQHVQLLHPENIPLAEAAGYKVYRSIAQMIGYYESVPIFKAAKTIIEDVGDWWERQIRVFNEYTEGTTKDPCQANRVIVFADCTDFKGDDGFFYPEVLYDIINVRIENYDEKDNFTYFMVGTNNGPLKHSYEPDWTTQEKSFGIWNEGREFSSGRDGGCLNCGGMYFVRMRK